MRPATAEGVAAVISTEPPRSRVLDVEALPHRIGPVRRIVSSQLHRWNLDPLVDTALLGVTELLANVHRHARYDKHCTVEMCLDKERLTISVTDHDPRPPRVDALSDTYATSGRGLAMLAALTDGWGSRPAHRGTGKAVWFVVRVPAAAFPPHPPSTAPPPAPGFPVTAAAPRPGRPRPVAVAAV